MNLEKKGILVVVSGFSGSGKGTIMKELLKKYPEQYALSISATTRQPREGETDGVEYFFKETKEFEQMIADGITEVIVQPTHVINGIENDLMKEDALAFKNHFERITFGDPLLTTQQDHVEIVNAICQEFSDLPSDCGLILMGHGTSHYANDVYAALDYRFKDLGHDNIHLATVEGYPTLENVIRLVKEQGAKKVILTPFMIVAGDHARNDMSGEDEDSWKNQFQAAGYEVECCLKGLGEYPAVQNMLIRHVTEVC